jgi:hypothetical protein
MMGDQISRKDDDTFLVPADKLEWLLHCTKNILTEDLKHFNGEPIARMVQSNLDWVYDAIALCEEE